MDDAKGEKGIGFAERGDVIGRHPLRILAAIMRTSRATGAQKVRPAHALAYRGVGR